MAVVTMIVLIVLLMLTTVAANKKKVGHNFRKKLEIPDQGHGRWLSIPGTERQSEIKYYRRQGGVTGSGNRFKHGHRETSHHRRSGFQENSLQDYRLIFTNGQGHGSTNAHHSSHRKRGKVPGYRYSRGHLRVPRGRRATTSANIFGRLSRGLTPPQGATYTWTRDFGLGKTFDEAAFKSRDKNVVVVLSLDDTLKDSNLTASSTLYDFTGASGVMAIKPRVRPGPCFLLDTSQTYDKVIVELESRNGSSVSTSTVISLDGTGNPVPLSERQAVLRKTPSLARQCRGRDVVRAKRKESSSVQYAGRTKELRVLGLDAEMVITVPVDPDLDNGPIRQWLQNGLKGQGFIKGQEHWKGH